MIEIFTDGACSGNPGPGGWGVLIVIGEDEAELYGGEAATTNNRMEMMAVIKALEATDPKAPAGPSVHGQSICQKRHYRVD